MASRGNATTSTSKLLPYVSITAQHTSPYILRNHKARPSNQIQDVANSPNDNPSPAATTVKKRKGKGDSQADPADEAMGNAAIREVKRARMSMNVDTRDEDEHDKDEDEEPEGEADSSTDVALMETEEEEMEEELGLQFIGHQPAAIRVKAEDVEITSLFGSTPGTPNNVQDVQPSEHTIQEAEPASLHTEVNTHAIPLPTIPNQICEQVAFLHGEVNGLKYLYSNNNSSSENEGDAASGGYDVPIDPRLEVVFRHGEIQSLKYGLRLKRSD